MKYQQIRKIFFALAITLVFSSVLFSKEIPKKPVPFRLLVDNAGVLSQTEYQTLSYKLLVFYDSTSTQICIVIDKSLEGEDEFDYSQRLAQAWGIGQKEHNNGLLIYIAIQEKRVRIQVGYGLEPVITDAKSKEAIEEYMRPEFRKGNYFAGLDNATNFLIRLADKEFPVDKFARKPIKKPITKYLPTLIIILLFIIFSGIFNRRNRGNKRTGWGPFVAGTGMFGGFGGGGFGGGGGGFGGGSFGGGGAGGGW